MKMRPIRLAIACVIGATLGLLAFVGVGYAADSKSNTGPAVTTIAIKPQAQLVTAPFGGGANVTVKYTCFPSPAGGKGGNFIQVSVTDLQGHSGFGQTGATCDDRVHSQTVLVQPFNGTFVAGDAAASAQLCGSQACASTTREIRLS